MKVTVQTNEGVRISVDSGRYSESDMTDFSFTMGSTMVEFKLRDSRLPVKVDKYPVKADKY